jgi:cellulose synthase/poly-beta-1,6-N-acetylglucosamine synthase-like glycosyltransferase
MIWVLGVILIPYLVLLIFSTHVWHSKRKRRDSLPGSTKSVSVLIPVRNEEQNLPNILGDLANQRRLSKNQLEVIAINDHSSDNTVKIINEHMSHFPVALRLVNLNAEQHGKKNALSVGVEAACHEIILCTDGDCRLGDLWVRKTLDAFQDDIVMLAGPVVYNPGSWWQELLAIEHLSLIGVGAGSMEMGIPNMVNGANLAYKRSAFLEVKGFDGNEHIPSGDDEFLMQKLNQRSSKAVCFNFDSSAKVTTPPPMSFLELLNQRRRWAGKWKHHSFKVKALALGIFFLYLGLIMNLFFLSSQAVISWFVVLLVTKGVMEWLLIREVSRSLKEKIRLQNVVALFIFYPFYVLFFGIISNFGTYYWKGRTNRV